MFNLKKKRGKIYNCSKQGTILSLMLFCFACGGNSDKEEKCNVMTEDV
jgi:hypothetical protein